MNKPVPLGQRKMRHSLWMALLLLIAFVVAVYTKAPAELFVTFVTGLGVQSGAFIWGNSQEHKFKKPDVTAAA